MTKCYIVVNAMTGEPVRVFHVEANASLFIIGRTESERNKKVYYIKESEISD